MRSKKSLESKHNEWREEAGAGLGRGRGAGGAGEAPPPPGPATRPPIDRVQRSVLLGTGDGSALWGIQFRGPVKVLDTDPSPFNG